MADRLHARSDDDRSVHRGRGAVTNPAGRFAHTVSSRVDDGWGHIETSPRDDFDAAMDDTAPATELRAERARTIITRNRSPDIPFDRSINTYRGCEHGCIYCYARPAHAYVDLSPGLDFETRILFKPDAPELLRAELSQPRYECAPIALGTNTDPYQPAERRLRLTRRILECLAEHAHPVTITTKGAAILDDLDLLTNLARRRLVSVAVSITTLDDDLKRRLEPRTPSGRARLRVVERLAEAGIPTGVMAAPMIPALNDAELERILEAARDAGASRANWILLRLPNEVEPLFRAWLSEHFPDRAEHVLSVIRQSRGGRGNDPRFGHRMRGEGPFAALLAKRFEIAARRLGLSTRGDGLDVTAFRPPAPCARHSEATPQLGLF